MISGGRIVARGAVAELLATAGVRVRAEDPAALRGALAAAGIAVRPAAAGDALVAESGPEAVGRAAARAGVVLLELRPAAGVEELFMALTAAGGVKEAA